MLPASTLVLAALGGNTDAPPLGYGATNPPPSARADETRGSRSDELREQWLLSLEAVTRVPVDAGAQVAFETPFGLRLFVGFGWTPYIDVLTGMVVNASSRNVVTALLDGSRVSGDSARVGLGFRPWRKLGIYLDTSYAHLRLGATTVVQPMTVRGYQFPGGTYQLDTALDLWGVELGYQLEVGRRLVLAAAGGVSGAIDSRTTIEPTGSAPNEPSLPEGARRVDRAFQTHLLPTFTLRIGFDAI